jgi:uncharacterized Zn finger protein
MEKYGEFLFKAESDDIQECLGSLSEEDIESCCEYKIFNRGYDYFHGGMVEQIWYNSKANTISAEVHGTKEYDVEIYVENGEVYGSCNCEYHDVCKHIIAVLLNLTDDGIENIPESTVIQAPAGESADFFKDYLFQLTKKELVDLVMKYVPDGYIRQVQNLKSPRKDALAVLGLVEKKIDGYLKDEDLLWDPSGMDAAIMKQLEKLKGFESLVPEKIGTLLILIMEGINDAFDEGYLYIDNYYYEDFYESEEFNQYVICFIQKLPFQNKIGFIQKLDKAMELMDYGTYDGIPDKYSSCFFQEESKQLKEYILNNIQTINKSFISRVYKVIEDGLDKSGKELILLTLSRAGSQEHVIKFVELLISQDRQTEAYRFLSEFLADRGGLIDNKIIELFLDLADETGSDIEKAAWIALKHNPNERNLSLIKSYGVTDTSPFEDLLKNNHPEELLSFYEKEKRLHDALKLISCESMFYDETIFLFFKRNKNSLTEQAEQYFLKRIDANLVSTGDNYYSKIAETVSQLKQINVALAMEVIADLQVNYKRRTKLISMLKRF